MAADSEIKNACADALRVCAGYNFRRTARVVTQLFDAAFAPTGLRSTQVAVLQMIELKRAPSVAQLAREMAMDPSALNRNLRPLIREGLVELAAAERGRAKLARLTPKGNAKVGELMGRWKQAQADFTRRFGAQRWKELLGELRSVADALEPRSRKRLSAATRRPVGAWKFRPAP